MILVGTLYKQSDKYLICNSIIDIDSELFISHNVRILREEFFDLSAYGLEADRLIFKELKQEDFRKMTDQEIYEASQQHPKSLSHLTVYLRNKKIDDLFQ